MYRPLFIFLQIPGLQLTTLFLAVRRIYEDELQITTLNAADN